MEKWRRPESVPIPTVYRKFTGKKPFGKSGKYPKFIVQDFTEDLRETVINHMIRHYLRDEPMSQNKGLVTDPLAVEDFIKMWNEAFDDKIALVCLLVNKDELEDESLPNLAGCNVTHYMTPDYEIPPLRSERANSLKKLVDECHGAVNCFKRYKVDGFMHAMGLSVDPIYRGQGIGLEIIKARFDLGRAVGIKLTVTIFSAIESQKIAEEAGFETLHEIEYSNFKDEEGNVLFKGMRPKSVKLMAARIE